MMTSLTHRDLMMTMLGVVVSVPGAYQLQFRTRVKRHLDALLLAPCVGEVSCIRQR